MVPGLNGRVNSVGETVMVQDSCRVSNGTRFKWSYKVYTAYKVHNVRKVDKVL